MKAIGLNSAISAEISNYAAGIAISKRGTSTILYKELISKL